MDLIHSSYVWNRILNCLRNEYQVLAMRIKHLLRPMAFNTLLEEANREGWIIPFASDLRGLDLDYEQVWVLDTLPSEHYTEEDRKYNVKLGYLFDVKSQKKIIVNQNFIEKCIVLKE